MNKRRRYKAKARRRLRRLGMRGWTVAVRFDDDWATDEAVRAIAETVQAPR